MGRVSGCESERNHIFWGGNIDWLYWGHPTTVLYHVLNIVRVKRSKARPLCHDSRDCRDTTCGRGRGNLRCNLDQYINISTALLLIRARFPWQTQRTCRNEILGFWRKSRDRFFLAQATRIHSHSMHIEKIIRQVFPVVHSPLATIPRPSLGCRRTVVWIQPPPKTQNV